MSKLSRPQQLAEAYFIKTLPHKIGLSEFQTIYGAGYNSGYLDAIAEMRAKLSPSSAAPQAEHSPPPPTPNDTDPQQAGQPSILPQEKQ